MLLPSPRELKNELALTPSQSDFIRSCRQTAQHLLVRKDPRLLVVMGPCSIHDLQSAMDYAKKFKALARYVESTCYLVMRAYGEKPRTITGWKGLLYDPHLDETHDIAKGLSLTRRLFLMLAEWEVPIATEFVDPLAAIYLDDLVTWGFIGARTSSSQPHRQLASHLPFPIGFKNELNGDIHSAIHGVLAAKESHAFLYVNAEGKLCSMRSTGNPFAHIVLRGSTRAPNYDPSTIQTTSNTLRSLQLPAKILIDCAHGNSQKESFKQKEVFYSIVEQFVEGNRDILGVMLESHLEEGNQSLSHTPLRYAVSITDPCLDWSSTEELLMWAHHQLASEGFQGINSSSSSVSLSSISSKRSNGASG